VLSDKSQRIDCVPGIHQGKGLRPIDTMQTALKKIRIFTVYSKIYISASKQLFSSIGNIFPSFENMALVNRVYSFSSNTLLCLYQAHHHK
jgi:hypothetical protein